MIASAVGIVLFMASLWGGAWLMHDTGVNDWWLFPGHITRIIGCLIGGVVAVVGTIGVLEDRRGW